MPPRNQAIASCTRLVLFVIAFGLFLLPAIRVKASDHTYCQDRDCSVEDDANPQWAGFKVLTFTCKLSPMRIPSLEHVRTLFRHLHRPASVNVPLDRVPVRMY